MTTLFIIVMGLAAFLGMMAALTAVCVLVAYTIVGTWKFMLWVVDSIFKTNLLRDSWL